MAAQQYKYNEKREIIAIRSQTLRYADWGKFYELYPGMIPTFNNCQCLEAQIMQRKINKAAGNPDLPTESLKFSLDDFQEPRHAEALKLAQQLTESDLIDDGSTDAFVDEAERRGIVLPYARGSNAKPGLLLAGPAGTGKSTLASIVFRQRYESEVACMWVTAITLIKKVQATYSNGYTGMSADEIIDAASYAPFLVLDDLGTKQPNGGVIAMSNDRVEIIYRIFDVREKRRLPTIVTTNLTDADELYTHLGQRLASRIRGLCHCVYLGGGDYRAPGDREEE